MPRRYPLLRKALAQASARSEEQLTSRAFAAPTPSAREERSPDDTTLQDSAPPTFSILEPSGNSAMPLQPKLTIGAPGDKYEQEADRVASQVMQRLDAAPNVAPNMAQSDPTVQREAMPDEDELQMKPALQREAMPDEDELQMKPVLQAKADEGTWAAPEDFETTLQQARGGGQPLADTVRQPLEDAFGGANFKGVSIHADAQADHLNQAIQAKAFTTQQDIFFRQGAYQPESHAGKELLAHELTHVVQQNSALQPPVQRRDDPTVQPSSAPPGSVQRLVGAKTFKKKTKLLGRKGASHQTFEQIEQGLAAYQANAGADAKTKLEQLDQLLAIAKAWLASPAAAKSSRRKYVERLIPELEQESETLLNSLESVEEDDFSTQNLNQDESKDQLNHDGQMSEVAYLKYRFGVRKNEKGDPKKIQGESSGWFFKPDVAVDKKNREHRGEENSGSGIPANNPEFAKRNVAMYRLDQLLQADVIPPTFIAQHQQKAGMVMQEVVGKSEKEIFLKNRTKNEEGMVLQAALKSGVARRALSKLYLLDIIAGQVDRHFGNYIVQLDQNNKATGVKGIDNDLAFGKNYKDIGYGSEHQFAHQKVAGKLAHELQEIDADFAQSIVNLVGKKAQVREALSGLISDDEIEATISRLESLARYLQELINAGSDRLKQSDQWQDSGEDD